jgi:hypothetical protein
LCNAIREEKMECHVELVREKKMHIGIWCGNLKERGYWENSGVDGRIMLKWILNK